MPPLPRPEPTAETITARWASVAHTLDWIHEVCKAMGDSTHVMHEALRDVPPAQWATWAGLVAQSLQVAQEGLLHSIGVDTAAVEATEAARHGMTLHEYRQWMIRQVAGINREARRLAADGQ